MPKSLQEAVNERVMEDIPKMLASFLLMFIYISITMGQMDCVENRVFLAWSGLFSILLALLTTCGLCSFFGLIFTPLHTFLPFLLLALGADDMFIIIQSFDYYAKAKPSQPWALDKRHEMESSVNIDSNALGECNTTTNCATGTKQSQ